MGQQKPFCPGLSGDATGQTWGQVSLYLPVIREGALKDQKIRSPCHLNHLGAVIRIPRVGQDLFPFFDPQSYACPCVFKGEGGKGYTGHGPLSMGGLLQMEPVSVGLDPVAVKLPQGFVIFPEPFAPKDKKFLRSWGKAVFAGEKEGQKIRNVIGVKVGEDDGIKIKVSDPAPKHFLQGPRTNVYEEGFALDL